MLVSSSYNGKEGLVKLGNWQLDVLGNLQHTLNLSNQPLDHITAFFV